MDIVALIGFTAGVITVVAFLPQVIRVWRTRSAEDLSMLSFGLMSCGAILWLTYGILKNDLPIILPNAVNLVMLVAIIVGKVKFG